MGTVAGGRGRARVQREEPHLRNTPLAGKHELFILPPRRPRDAQGRGADLRAARVRGQGLGGVGRERE